MALKYTRPYPFIIILYRMLAQVMSVLLQLLYRLYYENQIQLWLTSVRIVKDKPKCKQLGYDMVCDKSLKGAGRRRLGNFCKNICSEHIQNTSVHSTVQSTQTWTQPQAYYFTYYKHKHQKCKHLAMADTTTMTTLNW